MLQGWVVIAIALGYIGLLFVVASYGDRLRELGRGGKLRVLIYPLCLAIYCTSWTFFGSVGLASRSGFDFLTIYVGPILMIGLCYPLILRIVRLAKAQNITSIADFIAARYGKRQAVAATVALIAIVGTIPYIALQLKAVSASVGTIFTHVSGGAVLGTSLIVDISLLVAVAMAALRHPVRHPPYRCDRTSRRLDARDRDGIARQAGGLPRRRPVRDVLDVRRPGRLVLAGNGARRHGGRSHQAAGLLDDFRDDGIVVLRDRALAAAISCDGGREPPGIRSPPRGLAVSDLPRADQSVRHSDRAGRPADIRPRQGRQRHVRAGAAAVGRFQLLHHRRLCRRPLGRDRHGDRGIGRARHHGVERSRRSARAAAALAPAHVARRCRRIAADRAAHRDLRDPDPGLSLLPLGRRGAARSHRPSVVRGGCAARAGVFRRTDLAASHRARRHWRNGRRHRWSGPIRCCCRISRMPDSWARRS